MDKEQRELLENLRNIRENLEKDFMSEDKQNKYTKKIEIKFYF